MALYRWIRTESRWNIIRPAIIIIITITKPQAGKLGHIYKIMVATAIYSVTMVLLLLLLLVNLPAVDNL